MEEMAFKHAQGGWVYAAPNLWLFGSRQYYLLNDGQKSEVAARLQRMWRLLFVAMMVVVAVAVPIAIPGFNQHPLATLAAAMLIGLAVGAGANAYLCNAIRPIISGLEPTTERITQGEAFTIQVEAFSRGRIASFALLSLALFALFASRPLLASADWDMLSIFGALLFGIGTVYWVVLYVLKRKHSTA
jgi:hypothetical protein